MTLSWIRHMSGNQTLTQIVKSEKISEREDFDFCQFCFCKLIINKSISKSKIYSHVCYQQLQFSVQCSVSVPCLTMVKLNPRGFEIHPWAGGQIFIGTFTAIPHLHQLRSRCHCNKQWKHVGLWLLKEQLSAFFHRFRSFYVLVFSCLAQDKHLQI